MSFNPFATVRETVDLTPEVADEVRHTTCYMCACRCGIRVYLKDGTVRYIEGNPDHPVNRGVLCAKGSAGIMNHYSPARLTTPLLRVGDRGSGEFKEISWDEALQLAVQWLQEVRSNNPDRLAFFTGRDQSQSLTGWWASRFGTVNFAAHGGFCSVNMAAAGLYTVGGSFWEFGEPDWERTRYFMLFGVAEDHDSNPIKIGMGSVKNRDGTKIVSINPVRTGYSAIADEWLAITPGTDGLFILALVHELLRTDQVDLKYLSRYTNACWLVRQSPGDERDGLFVRDLHGNPCVFDCQRNTLVSYVDTVAPRISGVVDLADGGTAVSVFELLTRRYLSEEYAPAAVAEKTGIKGSTIRRIAAEIARVAFSEEVTIDQKWTDWQGRVHDHIVGRPVSMHAMRGISAHSNGFHTCRALHLLQALIGSIDVPGGWRYKAPYPKPIPPMPLPARPRNSPNTPLDTLTPIGNPQSPGDLLVDDDGNPLRLDKAYSWEYPLAAHGLLHMVLHNAWAQDPYPIDVLFMYMANMAWNSAMNVGDTLKYLTDKNADGSYRIPRFIYSDAYYSETVPYADLILPDTTYLERYDCISLLDRPISSAEGPGDAIRVPVEHPQREVRPFQEVLLDLGVRLKLPGMVDDDGNPLHPGGYADYIVNHQRAPGIGPLAGWRGDGTQHGRGDPNAEQLEKYIANGCFWQHTFPLEKQFYKNVNPAYLEEAKRFGWVGDANPVMLQLYSEPMQKFRLAAAGFGDHRVPKQHRQRVLDYFDPLPFWYEPFEQTLVNDGEFPLHAITQRPMHMYHSWGSQNSWLRQITNTNYLYIHPQTAALHQLKDGDWAWLYSHHSRIKLPVKISSGTNKGTVWTWNAIGKRRGAWALNEDADEFRRGFILNHLISDLLPRREGHYQYSNSDPVTGQAAWYDLRVRIEKCQPGEDEQVFPLYSATRSPSRKSVSVSRFGRAFKGKPSGKAATPVREWISHLRRES